MTKAGLDALKIDIMGDITDGFLNLHTRVIKTVKNGRRAKATEEEMRR